MEREAGSGTVRCWKCGTDKKPGEFPPSELSGNRKKRRCRACEAARSRAYNAAHRNERAAYALKWYYENKGYSAAHHKQWVKENPERARAIMAKWQNEKQRPYRMVAAEALGRPLRRREHVHHVNMDHGDNHIDNLWVCTGSAHRRAEGSLFRLVKPLMERGVVVFDRAAGEYRLVA